MRLAGWLAVGTLLGMSMISGCKRVAELPAPLRRAPLGPLVLQDQTVIDRQSTAQEVAWAFLQMLKARVDAVRLAEPDQRQAAVRRAESDLLSLVSNEALARNVRKRLGGEPTPTDPARFTQYVLLWPSTVAHYVDGFDRERLSVKPNDEQNAVAMLTAEHPRDRRVAQDLFEQITKRLAAQGLSGADLDRRRTVLLRRELAKRGIGYPVGAMITISLAKVDGYWRVAGLTLQAFRSMLGGPGPTSPLRISSTPATRSTTASAEPAESKNP